jgi:hypothetical protein
MIVSTSTSTSAGKKVTSECGSQSFKGMAAPTSEEILEHLRIGATAGNQREFFLGVICST